MGIALTPPTQYDALVAETGRRLLLPRKLQAAPKWGLQFEEGEIGLLYNCKFNQDGSVSWGGIRIGQGEEWLKHWQWQSAPIAALQLAPALVLAAKLLRCKAVLDALLAALSSQDNGLQHIVLAVLRRWLLSLKALAWLEDALHHPWRLVGPQDLACFAFSAVKPDWPRRTMAISHRSMDAKPPLQIMQAWRSSLFAIDANYAPSWETNTGMIWGLFAATPMIARIASPNYQASEWCQRESEMITYLADTCDFLPNRLVVDLDVQTLPVLDQMVQKFRPVLQASRPEFPPLSQIYIPNAQSEWPLAMLRASAALRILRALYGDHIVANKLCSFLCFRDEPFPAPPPTNHPEGWAAYQLRRHDPD